MLEKLLSLDRRWIFLTIGLVVVIPAIAKLKFPVTSVSESTQKLYDYIDELDEGSVVMVTLDYGPSSMAELQPQLAAILHHCFAKNIKVIGLNAFIFESVPLGKTEFDRVADQHDKKYGEDYCYLGFQPGGLAVLLGMGNDSGAIYKTDANRTPIEKIPMMSEIKNYDNVDLLMILASVGSPPAWVAYVFGRFSQQLATGVTGVMVSEQYPLIDAGQIVGMLPGLLGAAEYEKLIKEAGYTTESGQGAPGMSIQSFAHIALILIIIFCNIAFFIVQRRES